MTAFHSVNQGQSARKAEPESSARTNSTPANHPSDDPQPSPINHPSVFSPQNSAIDADFYQAAIIHAGIPVIPMDVAGHILAWNAAAVRMFARSESEVLGQSLDVLIPQEFRALASEAFQRTLQQRSVNIFEMTFIPEGGKNPLYVGVTLSCVMDAAGTLKGVTAWMRNITNRKELESHLDRTRNMAAVGTLAAGVAHHFNNIACGMGTMVEFALATEDPGAMRKALRMATEACTRIRYITQSLLDCSGQTVGIAGHVSSSHSPEQDLSDLTEEILGFADAVEPTLNQKGIALELDLRGGRVTAVPRIRFGQALQHLLQNAEDAIEARAAGTVGAERRITLRTLSQGDQIMLQFADTGDGIDADDLPRIFDPFFTKKGVQGGGSSNNPGLGLTLVHTVIAEIGGHIWADSQRHRGTTLNMLIPINT